MRERSGTEPTTTTSSTSTTTTTEPPEASGVVELAIGDVESPGVVQHVGRALVNLNGNNLTQEAQDRGVAGNWASTYRDASEVVGGWITIDPWNATVTGQVSERWTCTGACLERRRLLRHRVDSDHRWTTRRRRFRMDHRRHGLDLLLRSSWSGGEPFGLWR